MLKYATRLRVLALAVLKTDACPDNSISRVDDAETGVNEMDRPGMSVADVEVVDSLVMESEANCRIFPPDGTQATPSVAPELAESK